MTPDEQRVEQAARERLMRELDASQRDGRFSRIEEVDIRIVCTALAASEAEIASLKAMGQFLVDRIDGLEWSDDGYDDLFRDWMGHVDPALCRFRAALNGQVSPMTSPRSEDIVERLRRLLLALRAALTPLSGEDQSTAPQRRPPSQGIGT